MFKKVLIANRGEIAVRIARTLREMGVTSVAVCSDPDATALHARVADEVVPIGGDSPTSSYLDVQKIVDAAKASGAQAVHPGYGFLSESPILPEALSGAGIAFVGPPATVLAQVGDKLAARKLMEESGVPVVPGSFAPIEGAEMLASSGKEVGYPLLVKAAGGGGGRGMRVVREPEALADAAAEAGNEARAAFGDGRVYLERYLERPRHVEVQILADGQGGVVHLGERECSLQRRHQKIVEESPCPGIDDELRERICGTAVKAAKAAGYVNAGTVEFLLAPSGEFFFLEVNARLQVEHPVTELLTGLDLVRHQLEIAGGAPLPFDQSGVAPRGHAIECRIYAEDPSRGFAPSPGRIVALEPPSGPGVRFDCGVHAGAEVPVHYDPILAKLIVWAEDRPAALARMLRALGDTVVLGVETPIELLIDLLGSEAFGSGKTHTTLVDELLREWKPSTDADVLAAMGALALELTGKGAGRGAHDTGETASIPTPWQRLGRWDVVAP